MSETSSSVSSSSCVPTSSSTLSENEWLEEEEEPCLTMEVTTEPKYPVMFTAMVFEVDKIIFEGGNGSCGGGLKGAQEFLNMKIQNGQFYLSHFLAPVQNLHTLLPFLLLADVESRLGSVWSSYIATILIRKILEDFLSHNNNEDVHLLLEWIYWSQKLELKILQRAGAFGLYRDVTINFCTAYKSQRELERDAFSLDEETVEVEGGDLVRFENCQNCQIQPTWPWTRLIIIGDLLTQSRKFDEALTWYEKARDKIVDKLPPQCPEKDQTITINPVVVDGDNFFKVENRIVKLFIKMRRHAEALELALPLLTRQQNIFGENSNHYTILKTIYHISLLYKCQGNYRRALEFAESIGNSKVNSPQDSDPPSVGGNDLIFLRHLSPKLLSMVDLNLAELRVFLKKPSLALARGQYVQAFRANLKALGDTHPIILDSMTNIAKWFMSKKNLDKDVAFALRFMERVHKAQREMWGEEDPETRATGEYIGQGGILPSIKSTSMVAKGDDNAGSAVEKKGRKLGAYWDKLKKKRRDGMVAAAAAAATAATKGSCGSVNVDAGKDVKKLKEIPPMGDDTSGQSVR